MRTHAPLRITCFGGGTGLPSLLRGLKHLPWVEPTAVVTTFDDGGSSGILRDQFGILPPGDVVRCVLALAPDEEVARRTLLRRIDHSATPSSQHTGGNLLLASFERVYGTFADAVRILEEVLGARGHVLPVTLEDRRLCARFADGSHVVGEVALDAAVARGGTVAQLHLDRPAPASPDALAAIRDADAIVVGPGSFYTSVLPNFLPEGVRDATSASRAPLLFVANLVTESEGMRGSTIARLVEEVEAAVGRRVDAIVANATTPADPDLLAAYAAERKVPLTTQSVVDDPRLTVAELWVDHTIARHDSDRLASLVEHLARTLAQRR